MPTTYKATTDHRPPAWSAVVEEIDEFLDGQLATLAKLAGGDKADLEEDALEPLRESITMFLIQFLAKCSARPLRSPNKLKATLRYIARKPDEFINDPGAYDPEVVDWVYGAYASRSRDRLSELLRFESGEGVLSSEAVVAAAAAAIKEIERLNLGKEHGGRPIDNILDDFASGAVLLFEAAGGTATATADGPFWRFVELLRAPVSKAARAAGSSLTVDSVVRRAVKDPDSAGA